MKVFCVAQFLDSAFVVVIIPQPYHLSKSLLSSLRWCSSEIVSRTSQPRLAGGCHGGVKSATRDLSLRGIISGMPKDSGWAWEPSLAV